MSKKCSRPSILKIKSKMNRCKKASRISELSSGNQIDDLPGVKAIPNQYDPESQGVSDNR